MKAKIWLGLFILDAMLHLTTTVYPMHMLNLITKPLLMFLLGGYFVSVVGNSNNKIKYLVIAALIGSWFGDIFLMFQGNNPLFFIFGLGSFLLAHVAYISVFRKFKRSVNNRLSFVIIIVSIGYTAGLLYFLWPSLGEMTIPVLLYAFVLAVMGAVGVIQNLKLNNLIVFGVVLFVVSDSMIAYNKFAEAFSGSSFLIMLTYISAQYLLIQGLSSRIIKNQSLNSG